MSGRDSFFTDDEDDDDFEDPFAGLDTGDTDDDSFEEEDDEEESEDSDEKETPDNAQIAQQVAELQARLGGLQGALQKSQEEKQQMQMQFLGNQAKLRHTELLASGMDEQAAAAQIRAELSEVVLHIQGNSISTEKQALEEASRAIWAQQLAVKHGIPVDSAEFKRLILVKDPEDMAEMATLISSKQRVKTRTATKTKRQSSGADRFGTAQGSTSPRKKPAKNMDEALDRFMTARIRR
jgi:hypothetical protein